MKRDSSSITDVEYNDIVTVLTLTLESRHIKKRYEDVPFDRLSAKISLLITILRAEGHLYMSE